MKQADQAVLIKIIGYCDDISAILERFSKSRDLYDQDKVFQYAVNMCILQIGELASHLSDEFRSETAHIPWRLIRATRNLFAHNYEKAESQLMWQTITEDIPLLKQQLDDLLKHYPA